MDTLKGPTRAQRAAAVKIRVFSFKAIRTSKGWGVKIVDNDRYRCIEFRSASIDPENEYSEAENTVAYLIGAGWDVLGVNDNLNSYHFDGVVAVVDGPGNEHWEKWK